LLSSNSFLLFFFTTTLFYLFFFSAHPSPPVPLMPEGTARGGFAH